MKSPDSSELAQDRTDAATCREALAHLRELARERPLTLLTASKDPVISEAAVLAELLQERPRRSNS